MRKGFLGFYRNFYKGFVVLSSYEGSLFCFLYFVWGKILDRGFYDSSGIVGLFFLFVNNILSVF